MLFITTFKAKSSLMTKNVLITKKLIQKKTVITFSYFPQVVYFNIISVLLFFIYFFTESNAKNF